MVTADLSTGGLVLWTWFVWGGRIRNALGDPELGGSALVGTVVLASSFVVLATALAVMMVRDRVRGGPGGVRGALTWILALWTTGVWTLRVVDIAAFGGHGIGFVLVHVALAVVSIALAAWAVASMCRRRSSVSVATR